MIMDESQTSIPFDMQAYRVLKFTTNVKGIGDLRRELSKYIKQIEEGKVPTRDNLVHDWLPALPEDIISHVTRGAAPAQIEALERTRLQLEKYIRRFGALDEAEVYTNPKSAILLALEDARTQKLPSLIVNEAERLGEEGDVTGFLEQLNILVNLRSLRADKRMLVRMRYAAGKLDLKEIGETIMDFAIQQFPGDEGLRKERLEVLCHSDNPILQREAIAGLSKILGISEGPPAKFSRGFDRGDFSSFGLMLDAHHRLQMHAEALLLAETLNEKYPDNTKVLRLVGRALENIGRSEESLDIYIKSALSQDADDTTFLWLGNEMHNRGRPVDAVECYAAACILDPDDGANFSQLADDLSIAIRSDTHSLEQSTRKLPKSMMNVSHVAEVVRASLCCGPAKSVVGERLRRAAKRVEFGLEEILAELESDSSKRHSRSDRTRLAKQFYKELQSDLTKGSKAIPEPS